MPQPAGLELVRVGGATAVPEMLRDLGAEADAVIGAAGLSRAILADPESVIPFVTFRRLIRACVEATRSEEIGLRIGEKTSISSLGYLGVLVENSPDVHSALNELVSHYQIHDARGVPILEISRGTCSLGYTIFDYSAPGAPEIVDGAVASLCNIMRRLCGETWRPIEVMLPRPRPKDVKAFVGFFDAPVRFGAEHGLVVFSTEWLSRPVRDANPLVRRLVQQRIHEVEGHAAESLEGQMRRLLRTLVLARCYSLQTIAHYLHLQPRTLARRLEREEIQLRTLIDETRYEVARHLLADTRLPMSEVAALLDYSEASAFSRAFRRWSGRSPVEWRAEHLLARS
jgi:AraC-like DNA-binding protein